MGLLHACLTQMIPSLAAQTPVQVEIVQRALPESWVKWLLPTIVQTTMSLASITAGVWIALWSFGATSKRDHRQWLRDQRKEEWKELLINIAEIEFEIPILFTGAPDHTKFEKAVLEILPRLRGTVFIYSDLELNGFIGKWETFLQYVSGSFSRDTGTFRSIATGTIGMPVTTEDFTRWGERSTNAEVEVRNKFHSLLNELRTLADRSIASPPQR